MSVAARCRRPPSARSRTPERICTLARIEAARSADSGAVVDAGYVYGNNIVYRDITSGSNGASALVGYDLVTGRGSWCASSCP